MCLNSVENDNGQNLNLKEIILQERMIKSMTVITVTNQMKRKQYY